MTAGASVPGPGNGVASEDPASPCMVAVPTGPRCGLGVARGPRVGAAPAGPAEASATAQAANRTNGVRMGGPSIGDWGGSRLSRHLASRGTDLDGRPFHGPPSIRPEDDERSVPARYGPFVGIVGEGGLEPLCPPCSQPATMGNYGEVREDMGRFGPRIAQIVDRVHSTDDASIAHCASHFGAAEHSGRAWGRPVPPPRSRWDEPRPEGSAVTPPPRRRAGTVPAPSAPSR